MGGGLCYTAVGAAHCGRTLLTHAALATDGGAPLAMQALSQQACPASVLLPLRLSILCSLAPAGAALALAQAGDHAARRGPLAGALALHAFICLFATPVVPAGVPAAAALVRLAHLGTLAVSLAGAPLRRASGGGGPMAALAQCGARAAAPLAMLAAGAAAALSPGRIARACFRCLGNPASLPAAAMRSAGAALIPLSAGWMELLRQRGDDDDADPPLPINARRSLATSLACSAGAQALVLVRSPDAAAVRAAARIPLVALHGACAVSAAAHAVSFSLRPPFFDFSQIGKGAPEAHVHDNI